MKKRIPNEVFNKLPNEKWIEFQENYFVSSFARIFRVEHIKKNRVNSKFLLPSDDGKGYFEIRFNGSRYFLHRLVAKCFIKNTQNKPFINHIDSNPKNNCVDNLEWCTPQENITHSAKKGRQGQKLTEKDVIEIRISNEKHKVLADRYNVFISTISKVKRGETWSHLLCVK